ncbi:hypothetical protein CU097_002891 [Rhizopus azygosporus]|uniref:Uncharacterized protein n=1 Tax=Rhizopus azygosporus TaxID=86630 RepID=A0A367JPH1_RHIAZ|nr:hypothetical protein CU097_002891 [Rhizopus azygosporus]
MPLSMNLESLWRVLKVPRIRKEQTATRTKLKTAERTQSLRQVSLYADVLNELNESATNDYDIDEESEYSPRESTPSDANSGIEDEDDVYQFLTHSRDSYVLNNHEQLALNGIMLIDNNFVNTDIIDYHVAQGIMREIDEIDYCKPVEMEKAHAYLVSKFARDMAVRNIDQVKIEAYIKDFRNEQSTQDATTLDTIENLFKMYFPSTTLTKSVGADFFVVSNKANHVLLSLAAKSNKTKGMNDLTKLCREFEERPELFEELANKLTLERSDVGAMELPKEILEELEHSSSNTLHRGIKEFSKSIPKYEDNEWTASEMFNREFHKELKRRTIDAFQSTNVVYKKADRLIIAGRAAASLSEECKQFLEQGNEETFLHIMEGVRQLAIYSLVSSKTTNTEARPMALKALKLPDSVKHLDGESNDRSLALNEETVERSIK